MLHSMHDKTGFIAAVFRVGFICFVWAIEISAFAKPFFGD